MQVRELDINFACHSDGTTALGLACKLGNLPLTKLLLTHPLIDINYPNDEGNTPLMLACQCSKQSMELIITLLQAGASLIVQNHEKKNAMEIARENDNQVAVSAIRKYRQSQHLATNAKNNTSPIERQYSLNTVTAYGCTFFTSRRDDYNDKDVQSKYQFPR
jgi:ankyrin repeat protein